MTLARSISPGITLTFLYPSSAMKLVSRKERSRAQNIGSNLLLPATFGVLADVKKMMYRITMRKVTMVKGDVSGSFLIGPVAVQTLQNRRYRVFRWYPLCWVSC